jgi:hypothetical protein
MEIYKFNFLEAALAHKYTAKELSLNFKTSKDAELAKIVKLEKLETLVFTNFPDSVVLPISLFENKSIQSLQFHSCKFKKLPDAIYELVNLKELVLDEVYFQYLSPLIFKMPSLKILRWANQASSNLADNDFENQFIETFDFRGSLDQFFLMADRFKAVNSIILRENSLDSFPSELFRFKNLVSLNLSANSIRNLPTEISTFRKLETFELQENQLEILPDAFAELKNLKHINLSSNAFIQFPEQILKLKKLESLTIENHDISIFPETLSSLEKLRALHLNSKFFFYLPEYFIKWFEDEHKILSVNPIIEKIIESEFYKSVDPDLRKEIIKLFFLDYRRTERIRFKNSLELLKINNYKINQLAYRYFVDEPGLKFGKSDKIYFLKGENLNYDPLKAKLRAAGFSIAAKLSHRVRYIVVNHTIRFSEDTELLNGNWKFITAYNLVMNLKSELGYYILESDEAIDGIKTMLRGWSTDLDLLYLLLEAGGIPETLYSDFIYFYLSNKFRSKSSKILKLMKIFAKPGWDILVNCLENNEYNVSRIRSQVNFDYFDIELG